MGQVEEFATSKDGFNQGCKLHMIGKRGHYLINTVVNKLYLLEIQNSDNSLVKDISGNYVIIMVEQTDLSN